MSIFDRIARIATQSSLGQILEALLALRDQHGLNKNNTPFSVAELHLAAEDYAWLLSWTQQASASWLRRMLESTAGTSVNVRGDSWSGYIALGFVLTVAFAEYARRNFQDEDESAFWACLQRTLSTNAATLLFPDLQPCADIKDAISCAVQDPLIGLRHRFDERNVNKWYATIFAQFGVTHSYIINHLHAALVGLNVNRAVQYLRQVSKGSRSFDEFWETCYRFKQREIDEPPVRQLLYSNPFILPEWVDDVISACQKRLGRSNTRYIEPAPNWHEFVEPPRLFWDGYAQPRFVLRLLNNQISLEGDTDASVLVNGHKVETLLRATSNSAFEPCRPIELTHEFMTPSITLAIDVETARAEQELELWSEAELITAFDLATGLKLPSVESLPSNHPFALIVPNDMKVRGGAQKTWLGEWQLHRIPAGHTGDIRVEDELGTVFWTAQGSLTPRDDFEVRIAHVHQDDESSDDFSLQLRITTRPEIPLEAARIGSIRIAIQHSESGWITAPIQIGSALASPTLTLYIKPVGGRFAYAKSFAPLLRGCLIKRDSEWQVIKPYESLVADDVARSPLRAFGFLENTQLPNSDNAPIFFVDGIRAVGSVLRRVQILSKLDGYGESLRICRGHVDQTDIATIGRSVIWHGLIESVMPDERHKSITLKLRRENSLDGYTVVGWHSQAAVSFKPLDDDNVLDANRIQQLFEVFWPVREPLPHIVALAYKGECRGVWWSDDLPARLNKNGTELSASDVLLLMRWLHLPVLSLPFNSWALEALLTAPHSVGQWLYHGLLALTCMPGMKLNFKARGEEQEAWMRVVRQFLHTHEAPLAARLVKKTTCGTAEVFDALCDVSPRLALTAISHACNRTMALNKIYARERLTESLDNDGLPYTEDDVIWRVERYLREADYPYDLMILRLLDKPRVRAWILDNCLDRKVIHEALWRASRQSQCASH